MVTVLPANALIIAPRPRLLYACWTINVVENVPTLFCPNSFIQNWEMEQNAMFKQIPNLRIYDFKSTWFLLKNIKWPEGNLNLKTPSLSLVFPLYRFPLGRFRVQNGIFG